MSQIENLLNPPKTTNVRWDLPKSTMKIIKGYQKQMWAATGKYPTLPQIIVHMIEYVGKDACDQYFAGIVERKQQEKEALAEKELFDKRKKDLLEF
jgi:hypothetical protein